MIVYLLQNDEVSGPFTLEEISRKVQSGDVDETDLVALDGSDQWVPITEIISFRTETPSSSAPATRIAPSAVSFQKRPVGKLHAANPEQPSPSAAAQILSARKKAQSKESPTKKALIVAALAVWLVVGIGALALSMKPHRLGPGFQSGTTAQVSLDFSGGIEGEWRGSDLKVEEHPYILPDGTSIDWQFKSTGTSSSRWGKRITTDIGAGGNRGGGWVRVGLPDDERLIGKTLEFDVSLLVVRPERTQNYIVGGNFENVEFSHKERCSVRIARQSDLEIEAKKDRLLMVGLGTLAGGALILTMIPRQRLF